MTDLQENLNDLCSKFTDIYSLLNINIDLSNTQENTNFLKTQEEIIKNCGLFVNNLKDDTEVLKLFKDRNWKCFEHVVFFNNEYDEVLFEYIKTKDINDVIWSNLQLIVLLYELTHDGSKHLIKKLYKKIKVNDKLNKPNNQTNEKNDVLSDDVKNKMLEDLKKMIPKPNSQQGTKSVIKELLGDIREKLNEKDKFEASDIMNLTRDLSTVYQNKIQSGEMDIGNLLTGVLDLMNDPSNLSNEFSGIENKINSNPMELMQAMQDTFKKEGGQNPFDILNNLSQSVPNNGSNDMKNLMSMVNMVSQGNQNGAAGINPLSLLSGGLGGGLGSVVGNLLEGEKQPESEEEIKKKQEMLEEYYKNLQL